MQCDMCGKEKELAVAIVEGSQMNLCERCSKFGRVISSPEQKKAPDRKPKQVRMPEDDYRIITRDFARIVKEAREKLGLEQHQLAERIAERESVIHRIESGLLEPPIKLAKKLEIALKIKLIEFYAEEQTSKVDFSKGGLTIGDLLKIKK